MVKLKIKEILDARDKSMYWLAKKTDLSYTAIYKMAQGETNGIQFNTLKEIMLALNINDFNEILEIVPDK